MYNIRQNTPTTIQKEKCSRGSMSPDPQSFHAYPQIRRRHAPVIRQTDLGCTILLNIRAGDIHVC